MIFHLGNKEDGYILIDLLIAFFLLLIGFSTIFSALSNGLYRSSLLKRDYLEHLDDRNSLVKEGEIEDE